MVIHSISDDDDNDDFFFEMESHSVTQAEECNGTILAHYNLCLSVQAILLPQPLEKLGLQARATTVG